MNNTENTDSTTTPTNGAPVAEVASKSLLPSFPTIVNQTAGEVIAYGSRPLVFPIGNNGETATIDGSLLSGKGTKRLLNIKQALKVAGKTNDAENRKWFNGTVRDVWHKVLRFAARDSLANGRPASLGLSTKTNKKTGQVTLTSKHGFEHVIVAPTVKAVEASADTATKSIKAPKAPAKAKSKRISPLPNPVIPTPEQTPAAVPAAA